MTNNNARKMFVNVATKDLKASMDFFKTLGFQFNPKFTDDKAACMIISDEAFLMILAEPFFKTFTTKAPCDTNTNTEALICISCNSRDEVNDMVNKAIAAGGKHAKEPMDHGFMYGWSFYDLDGHHWEVMWMNPSAA